MCWRESMLAFSAVGYGERHLRGRVGLLGLAAQLWGCCSAGQGQTGWQQHSGHKAGLLPCLSAVWNSWDMEGPLCGDQLSNCCLFLGWQILCYARRRLMVREVCAPAPQVVFSTVNYTPLHLDVGAELSRDSVFTYSSIWWWVWSAYCRNEVSYDGSTSVHRHLMCLPRWLASAWAMMAGREKTPRLFTSLRVWKK